MTINLKIIIMAVIMISAMMVLPPNAIAEKSGSEASAPAIHKGEGKVLQVKKRSGKVKLEHGPIKSIGWMGMKMVFDVENKKLLKGIKVGDKVSFEFYSAGDGRYVVTKITHLK